MEINYVNVAIVGLRRSLCSTYCRDMALIETNPHGYGHITRKYLSEECFLCNAENAYALHGGEIHHIIPVKDGGPNKINNLALLCHDCHQRVGRWLRMIKKILENDIENDVENIESSQTSFDLGE